MKLLFDQMLSPKLVRLLADAFPQSTHTQMLGFERAADPIVWTYAREHGFTIVTKDADYEDLSLIRGWPPKVILITSGNGPAKPVFASLMAYRDVVVTFLDDTERGVFLLG